MISLIYNTIYLKLTYIDRDMENRDDSISIAQMNDNSVTTVQEWSCTTKVTKLTKVTKVTKHGLFII